jgi:hypothetical protein
LRRGELPLTLADIKYGAETMINPGQYKKLDDMLAYEKREKILDVKRQLLSQTDMKKAPTFIAPSFA